MPDIADKIISYEQGDMTQKQVIKFFQELVDLGLVWQLQGSYGRVAMSLINAGLVRRYKEVNGENAYENA